MDPLGTARLTELAEWKLQLLTQLRALSLDQHQFADERRSEELLAILSRKSDLIELLGKVQEELRPYQAQEPDQRRWISESERDRCRLMLKNSDDLIAEILTIDSQTLGEMTLQRDLIGQQLSQFTSAEAIHDAYRGNPDDDAIGTESILSLDG